jgi:peptidylprolyl isomerase domain and WD repeat-containing protein 1
MTVFLCEYILLYSWHVISYSPLFFHAFFKVVNLQTNKVARILGKVENNDRFLQIALYQGDRSSKKVRKIPTAAANVNESKDPLTDPTLLCCAFKKHRIYLFR